MTRIYLILFFLLISSLTQIKAQFGPDDDFDGDLIINSLDLDDDNDGVIDLIECPQTQIISNSNCDPERDNDVFINLFMILPLGRLPSLVLGTLTQV